MNKFLKILAKPFHRWTKKRRLAYYKKLQHRLTNKTPTILSNDCLGGMIYHNLGLKFQTPTINTGLFGNDFIVFLKNINEYLNLPVLELENSPYDYPVGTLTYNKQQILLHFVHNKTFAEGKEKWETRKSRIDFNNIYVIWTIGNDLTTEALQEFDQLPYKNKLIIAGANPWNCDYIVTHRVYTKKKVRPGEILDYPSRFSVKRYMDEIDYVSFLNQPAR